MGNVFYRIDDRLIHGQVITAWSKHYKLERIIIVDNQVADDPIQKQIINAVAPPDIAVEISSVNDGLKKIKEAEEVGASTLVLVKGPQTLNELINLGVEFKEVIIGGMQFKGGRRQITRTVSLTQDEAQEFWKLHDNGVELFIQLIPTERRSQIVSVLNRIFPKG